MDSASKVAQQEDIPERSRFRLPGWIGACLFLAIALVLLWEEHEAHILGAFPYVFLLACPIIHLLMHRGHGHHRRGES